MSRSAAGYRGESMSMHRRGGSGLERLQGCAGDVRVLRVVFGMASVAHFGVSEGHSVALGIQFWIRRRSFLNFRE